MRAFCLTGTLVALIAIILLSDASGETFPSRPVKVITDVGTGGTFDIFARALGDELNKKWGQGVVVEPHPGGNGVIGNRACAESSPDGYTFCMLSNQGLIANEFLYKNVPYTLASFSPVMNLFYNTQVLVVSASLGVRNVDELAALAKTKPGTLNYVAPGIFQRLFFDNFNKKYGTDLVGIPFKGGADTVTGILSGTIPIAFLGGANFAAYVQEGKMVALAVDAMARSPLFPETPTLAEAGITDRTTRTYVALMVPAGTPQQIVTKLHADVTAIMNEPSFRKRQLIDRALEPVVDSPEEFGRFLQQDRALTAELAKAGGIQPQ
jgi:tripartite-type tricarboxylate transporter receptor subunit TctC